MSKTQIDRLGDRLKRGQRSESDLILLDEYRRSFGETYEMVVRTVRERLGVEPSGRPAKSTDSIMEKLRRESVRLTQMQDIAGCRVVVDNLEAQDLAVAQLVRAFSKTSVVDRRKAPSHGYRAIHVIADVGGQPVEIQIRTKLQHLWAELSEKLSDVMPSEPPIKYGGGPQEVQEPILERSAIIDEIERLEQQQAPADVIQALKRQIEEAHSQMLKRLDARDRP